MNRGNLHLNSGFKNSLLKFLTVGVINTLLSIFVIFSLKYFYHLNDIAANLVGYMLGLACSFVLNRNWTFKHSGVLIPTVLKFILVFFVAYTANLSMVLFFIKLGFNAYFSHLLGIPIYTAIFYMGSKIYVFKSNP